MECRLSIDIRWQRYVFVLRPDVYLAEMQGMSIKQIQNHIITKDSYAPTHFGIFMYRYNERAFPFVSLGQHSLIYWIMGIFLQQ